MARRLIQEAGPDLASIVKRAWLLAYSRIPTATEIHEASDFIHEAQSTHSSAGPAEARDIALREFCLALFNTTEFISSP